MRTNAVNPRKTRRNTRQRQVVLEELRRLRCHPTASALYEIARNRLPKISLGTVYRNLELLADNGVIQKLQMSGSEARYDGSPEPHQHVRCVNCDRVDDVHDMPGDVLKGQVMSSSGYKIIGFRLEFMGICPTCQGK